jgi:uncharacterized protein YxjI
VPSWDKKFASCQQLTVRQRKRWAEVLLSLEMVNTYDVYDDRHLPVMRVQEEGSGILQFLKRVFIGPIRPFLASVLDLETNQLLLSLRRPFRFFFHRLEISTADGQRLGSIERQWSWLHRHYFIENAQGARVAELFAPLLHPWTFEIQINHQIQGFIRKRWSGLMKESFTDADNFGVDLSGITDPHLKALAFAATVLIDVVHFERK